MSNGGGNDRFGKGRKFQMELRAEISYRKGPVTWSSLVRWTLGPQGQERTRPSIDSTTLSWNFRDSTLWIIHRAVDNSRSTVTTSESITVH